MAKALQVVAVAGATGAVGSEMIRVLEARKFPVKELRPLASSRSLGRRIRFRGKSVAVRELTKDAFEGVDIALFSAGASRSLEFAPYAVKAGAVVIDNSSAYRMDSKVPLVVAEVNPEAIAKHRGIIANPNCSTIQMVAALKPLHDAAALRRVVVSTYQAASGAGSKAMYQLWEETGALLNRWGRFERVSEGYRLTGPARRKIAQPLPDQIAFNVIPQVDVFLDDGSTKEEQKMINETRKILGLKSLRISATCVRVPVYVSHAESVNLEFARDLSPGRAERLLRKAPGVKVVNDGRRPYPVSIDASGEDHVYVGRIRRDPSVKHGLQLWVVSDNLRKGAALNAVQIAEKLL